MRPCQIRRRIQRNHWKLMRPLRDEQLRSYQLTWFRIFEGLQEYAINDRENRRVSGQTHSKRKDSDGSEARRFRQHAQPEANVLREILNPIYAARITTLFFALLHAADFEQRRAPRFLRRHAPRHIFFGFFFDVIPKFVVKFLIRLTSTKQRPQSQWNCVEPMFRSHCRLLAYPYRQASLSLTTREIAPESLPQFSASLSSCRRPSLVSE